MNIMEPCYYRIFLEKVDIIQFFLFLKKKYVMQACTTFRNVFIEKNIKTCLHFLPFFNYRLHIASTTF